MFYKGFQSFLGKGYFDLSYWVIGRADEGKKLSDWGFICNPGMGYS